jgi:ABC-type nitrate/sulfonate/bicarbonate transport system permease component
MGTFRRVEWVLDPYVTFLYVLPSVAFVPLLVIWFGFELQLRLILVFLSGVFPLIIATMLGVKNVDANFVDGGRTFGASRLQLVRTVVLPSSLPFIFAGFRLAFSAAWVGVIVAEMTALIVGIGGEILRYGNRFETADVLATVLVIMIVAILIQALTGWLQRRLAPWHEVNVAGV